MSAPTQRAPKPRTLPTRPDEVPYAFAVEVQHNDRARTVFIRCPWCATLHPVVHNLDGVTSDEVALVSPCLLGEYVVVIPAGTPMRRVA